MTIRVHATSDSVASPPVAGCVSGGSVGGNVSVHVGVALPPEAQGVSFRELRVHEVAGHTGDLVHTGAFSGAAHPECGDSSSMVWGDVGCVTSMFHNGEHLITAIVDYWLFDQGLYVRHTLTGSLTINVGNLVITGTTPQNPAPVLWDPETMQDAPLVAAFSCAYRASGTAEVAIYTAEGQLVRTLSRPFETSAPNVAFVWDGTTDSEWEVGSFTAPAGVYLFRFKLRVESHGMFYEDSDKSDYLKVEGAEVELYDHDDSNNATIFDVRYWLSDAGNPMEQASQAEVSVYQDAPPALLNTAQGTTLTGPPPGGEFNLLSMPVTLDANGDLIFLVSAKDGHAAQNRGHGQKWRSSGPFPCASRSQITTIRLPMPPESTRARVCGSEDCATSPPPLPTRGYTMREPTAPSLARLLSPDFRRTA